MAEILYGKQPAEAILQDVRARAENLIARGKTPTLAVFGVGDDPASAGYLASLRKSAARAAVAVREVLLPEDAKAETLLSELERLNCDASVHGVLLLLPLPSHLEDAEETLRASLRPDKDVDGVTPLSAAGTFRANPIGFTPCAAEACIRVLDFYGIDCAGKRAVIVGRGAVVGKPASMLLLQRDATVTVCHTKTENLAEETKRAELVVAAAGCADLLGRAHLSENAVVLSVGVSWDDQKGKLVGDVQDEALEKVAAYTPVPGGIGAMTSAVLMEHVVTAAETA